MKYVISILLFVLFIGCSENNEIPEEQLFLKSYLENKGYRVISYEGRIDEYELTKEIIVSLPYMMYWGLQSSSPSHYFGKNISIEKFIVTNHPLTARKVDVYVYNVDERPIGGTSYPHGEALSAGGYWSLEGKTLEEVQAVSYVEWSKDWIHKYKNMKR